MESEVPAKAPRKHKFKPKAPTRPVIKAEVKDEKIEHEDIDATRAMDLMRQFQERSNRAKAKAEKKVKGSQIAFGFGAASTNIKSFGTPKSGSASNRSQQSTFNGGSTNSSLGGKEYVEPWDYYSYYPVTLPLRRPYSGDPAILDAEEFGEAAEAEYYDENSTTSAEELGLLEENVEASTFLIQLPPVMPTIKRSAAADGQKESATPSGGQRTADRGVKLNELPAGFMGKMLVYRSGAVKLKLGESVYNVSPGMDCIFSQEALAINTAEKHCSFVAEITKRATITPEVDAITSGMANL